MNRENSQSPIVNRQNFEEEDEKEEDDESQHVFASGCQYVLVVEPDWGRAGGVLKGVFSSFHLSAGGGEVRLRVVLRRLARRGRWQWEFVEGGAGRRVWEARNRN